MKSKLNKEILSGKTDSENWD